MSEWRGYKLGDLLTLEYGKSLSDYHKQSGPYPVFGTNGSIGYANTCLSSIPSVIIGRKGAYRGVHFSSKPFFVIDTAFYVKPKSINFDMKYIFYFISTLDINAMDSGSAIPSTDRYELYEIDILLPPLPEQKAIAAVLSSLDDKIDLLRRQNKTLEAMAETLFRQWFVEEADDGWEEGKLTDIIEIQSGFPFKSEMFTDIGPYRLVTIKAVQDGFLELNNADGISEIPPRMPQYCHLNEKDILLSLTGNVGRCCIVDKNNLLLNQRVAKIHPKIEKDRAFSYFFFRLRDTRRQLEEMAKGTAQANLSPIETGNMPIAIPTRSLLDKFSMVSTPLFDKIMKNKKSVHTLEKLRDTLLPKLMSGEVRVAL